MQYTLFSHCYVRGVGKVNKSPDHLRADITQGDLRSVTLLEAAGKHGSEVGATGGQHNFVNLKKKQKTKVVMIMKHWKCAQQLNDKRSKKNYELILN